MNLTGNFTVIVISLILVVSSVMTYKFGEAGIIYNGFFLISLLVLARFYDKATKFLGGVAIFASLIYLLPALNKFTDDFRISAVYLILLAGGIYSGIIIDGFKWPTPCLIHGCRRALSDIDKWLTLILLAEAGVFAGFVSYIFLNKNAPSVLPYHLTAAVTFLFMVLAEEMVVRNIIAGGALKLASKGVSLFIVPFYWVIFTGTSITDKSVLYLIGVLLTFLYIWRRDLKVNVFVNYIIKLTVWGLIMVMGY